MSSLITVMQQYLYIYVWQHDTDVLFSTNQGHDERVEWWAIWISPLGMNLLNYFFDQAILKLNLESVDFHLWAFVCAALQSISIKLLVYSR